MRRATVVLSGIILLVGLAYVLKSKKRSQPATTAEQTQPAQTARKKLYWFVPDGMRADPDLFNVFRWAEEGKLPNLKKMMERGTYGYCKPVFPSHTPANFATLFTGAYPEVHGVNDGPMRAEGVPLSQIAISGFSSAAKKVEPIWVTLEKQLSCPITLLSVPGSTPPELKNGITIRGRWGRWGADFHSVNFQDDAEKTFAKVDKAAARLFYVGPQLTTRVAKQPVQGWTALPKSFSPPLETPLTAWGATNYACIVDSTDNQTLDYDTLVISSDKTTVRCSLKSGAWSDWLPITLKWQIPGQPLSKDVDLSVKIKLIVLQPDGVFRVRFVYSNVNKYLTEPESVAGELVEGTGPMVDFVDNFPPQLIFYPEDKGTFLEEADLSLTWHARAATFLLQRHHPDIFIQNIYTPNQMLTSRWWMGGVDPHSARYGEVTSEAREKLWQEVHWLYKKLDDILGNMLAQADANTFVVLSSDHGAVPLNHHVRLNNLFAREGLLKFKTDAATGDRAIDWEQSKAVFLQMDNVYISPTGLGGNWKRSSGPEYEQLRARVKSLLLNLEDARGVKPLEQVSDSENVARDFKLLADRAGDLILANRSGYGWSEETTEDMEIFSTPLITGYKQAILSEREKGLWTPFVIIGPGIKGNQFLGETPIDMVDQYPTLLRALEVKPSSWVQGKVVEKAWTRQ
ncbi:MAG TPA: alkaline phosphatase family protein [Candidatus Limnocylindria bacterium]|nr:alkaline phosphatase family protein [Candidatus Limnocylindria bacterium]